MVATTHLKISKDAEKLPVGKISSLSKHSVSPDQTDEIDSLRAKNKVLTDALASIHKKAKEEMKRTYDLVWFAKYRYRYPNHEASKRIDEAKEYREELMKLRGDDGDFHHGFNCGVLAASRMVLAQSDVTHINDLELSPEMLAEAAKHTTKIKESTEQFPHFEVTNSFPHSEAK